MFFKNAVFSEYIIELLGDIDYVITKNEQVVLVKGGLEILVKLTVTMKNTPETKQAMTKYNKLINHLYKNQLIDNLKMYNITRNYLKA